MIWATVNRRHRPLIQELFSSSYEARLESMEPLRQDFNDERKTLKSDLLPYCRPRVEGVVNMEKGDEKRKKRNEIWKRKRGPNESVIICKFGLGRNPPTLEHSGWFRFQPFCFVWWWCCWILWHLQYSKSMHVVSHQNFLQGFSCYSL